MADEYLSKSTVSKLREQCTQRKLESTGKKSELVQRLCSYLDEHPDDELAKTINGTDEAKEADEADDDVQIIEDEQEEEEEKEEEEEEEEEEKEKEQDQEEETEEKENGEKEEETEEKETKDEKKDKKEEKKTPVKAKARPPGPRDFKRDSNVDMRRRSVVVGPITPEDLMKDEIQEYAKKASCFFVRIHHDIEGDKHVGHVEYRFNTWLEAENAAEEFPKLTEDTVVKRLAEKMSAEHVDREIRKTENSEREELDLRTISAYNIPESTSDEELKSVFSEAKSMLIAKDDEGKFKGLVYLEYETVEKTKEAYENFKEGETKIGEQKVNFSRIATIPRTRKGMFGKDGAHDSGKSLTEPLADERRDFLVQKRKELNNKLNGPMPMGRRRNFENQIAKIERRLETDNEIRKKKGLPRKGPKLGGPVKRQSSGFGQQNNRSPRAGAGGRAGTSPRGRGAMRTGGMRQGGRTPQGRMSRGGGSGGGGNRGPMQQRMNRGGGGNFRSNRMSPNRAGNRFGGNRGGGGGMSGGQMSHQGGPQGGGPQGRLNPQATANAVNLLVGLSNMLNTPGGGGGNQMGHRSDGNYNQGGGGGGAGNMGWNDRSNFNNNQYDNQQSGSNWNQGGGGGGSMYNMGGGGGSGGDRGNWDHGNRGGNYSMGGSSGGNYNDNYYDDPNTKRSRMDYGSGGGMSDSGNWNTGGGFGGGSSGNMGNYSSGGSFGSGGGGTGDYSRFNMGSSSSNISNFGSGGGGGNYRSGGDYNSGGYGGNNRKRSRSKSGGYY